MTPTMQWALLWRSKNRLDGVTCHLEFDNRLPALFVTRAQARQYAEKRYSYIKTRKDLRAEPHCWRMPQPIRVVISVLEEAEDAR